MFNVFSSIETSLTKCNILTSGAFINSAFLINLFKLATITVVIVADTDFFAVNALFNLILFDFDDTQVFLTFYIPAQRTFNDSIIFELIFHPLREAI